MIRSAKWRGTSTRRTGVAASAVAFALALAACGGVGADDEPESGSDSTTGPQSFTVSGFGADDEIGQIRLALAEKNLGAKAKLNKGAFDEQQFLAAVAAGNPPDVVNMGRDQVASYAARGALIPVDDCIAKEHIDVSQYREQAMSPVTYEGKTYGIPEFYNYPLLLVNNRVAKEAGVDPKSIDTGDWESLIDAAQKMTKMEGGKLVRLGFDPSLPDSSVLWSAIHEIQLMGDDGLSARIDDPAVVDVMTNLKRLADAQGGWTKVKSFKDSWDFFGAENPFVTDQVGAMIVEQWYLTVLAETAPTKVDFTVVPIKNARGEPVTTAGGAAWVIPKDSKHPDLACKFAKEMTSVPAWIAAAEGKVKAFAKEGKYYAGTYTGNLKADEQIFADASGEGIWKPAGGEMSVFDDAVRNALEQQSHAVIQPASPIGAQFADAMVKAVNRILQGEQDPAASLQRAQSDVDKAAQAVR
ncbi:MAG TPA: extracellular solute-binding protein [Actinopolymorphaceae bacterium]